jgi:hypothetical protein
MLVSRSRVAHQHTKHTHTHTHTHKHTHTQTYAHSHAPEQLQRRAAAQPQEAPVEGLKLALHRARQQVLRVRAHILCHVARCHGRVGAASCGAGVWRRVGNRGGAGGVVRQQVHAGALPKARLHLDLAAWCVGRGGWRCAPGVWCTSRRRTAMACATPAAERGITGRAPACMREHMPAARHAPHTPER